MRRTGSSPSLAWLLVLLGSLWESIFLSLPILPFLSFHTAKNASSILVLNYSSSCFSAHPHRPPSSTNLSLFNITIHKALRFSLMLTISSRISCYRETILLIFIRIYHSRLSYPRFVQPSTRHRNHPSRLENVRQEGYVIDGWHCLSRGIPRHNRFIAFNAHVMRFRSRNL